jgi:hypothetical protein
MSTIETMESKMNKPLKAGIMAIATTFCLSACSAKQSMPSEDVKAEAAKIMETDPTYQQAQKRVFSALFN